MNLKVINGTERITGTADDKARRVLNTSHKPANITAEEIEAGVTSERLDSIGVPVYRYKTCLTIHGVLPNFNSQRVGGYKALTQNKNGSIGVRYIAIDHEKKRTIAKRSRYGVKGYHVSVCSIDFSISKCFGDYTTENLETAKAELEKVPTNFTGTAYLGAERMPYGGTPKLFLDIVLGAIPAGAVDTFAEFITGITTEEAEAKIREQEEDFRKRQEEYTKQQEQDNLDRQEAKEKLEAMAVGRYTTPGVYKRYGVQYFRPFHIAFQTVEIKKHGTGFKVSYPSKPEKKATIQEAKTIMQWHLKKI